MGRHPRLLPGSVPMGRPPRRRPTQRWHVASPGSHRALVVATAWRGRGSMEERRVGASLHGRAGRLMAPRQGRALSTASSTVA
eukprot:4631058-Alexandrium_andersonii.AAC.1